MLFWVVIAGITAVEAAIIITALRMHVESDPSRGILGARPTEVVWTLLPLLLVAALALYSLDARDARDAREDSEASASGSAASGTIELVGQQVW